MEVPNFSSTSGLLPAFSLERPEKLGAFSLQKLPRFRVQEREPRRVPGCQNHSLPTFGCERQAITDLLEALDDAPGINLHDPIRNTGVRIKPAGLGHEPENVLERDRVHAGETELSIRISLAEAQQLSEDVRPVMGHDSGDPRVG